MHSRSSGFTIVELLIVIVVIGVLAAITIVSFNGIQNRAQNASKYQAVANYEKALSAYRTINSTYPAMGQSSVCLGLGYTDKVLGDGIGECGGSDYTTREDATFNAALKQVLSAIPAASNQLVTKENGETFVGATLTRWDDFYVDGVMSPYFVQFVLNGSNQDCKVSGIVQVKQPENIWGQMERASTEKNTFYDSKSTTCVVALPNPG